jgi:hypothetical protein
MASVRCWTWPDIRTSTRANFAPQPSKTKQPPLSRCVAVPATGSATVSARVVWFGRIFELMVMKEMIPFFTPEDKE